MDWSKAKTIIIIALLITNLILGGFLVNDHMRDVNTEKEAAASAESYLAERGITLSCRIPASATRLPVLFVDFEEEAAKKDLFYKGYPLCISGESEIQAASLHAGDVKAKVCGAAAAVIRAVVQNDAIREIREIRLVYWVDRSGYTEAGEDTAFPAWYIDTDAGTFYIEALN